MTEKNSRMYLCAEIKAKTLKTVIDAVKLFHYEMKLHVSPDKITTKQVDQAHVGMINVEMKKNLFESYKASEFEMGVDLDKLEALLKLAKSDDMVKLEVDDKVDSCLHVSFDIIKRRIGCIDTSGMPDPKLPNIKTVVSAKLKKHDLELSLKAASQLTDYFKILATRNILQISTEDDVDKVDIKLENGNSGKLLEMSKINEAVQSMYTTDFIRNCIKTAGGDVPVSIGFSKDKPIKLDYEMEEGKLTFNYMVAPRIESE